MVVRYPFVHLDVYLCVMAINKPDIIATDAHIIKDKRFNSEVVLENKFVNMLYHTPSYICFHILKTNEEIFSPQL